MVQNFDSRDRDHERWTLKENYQVKKRTELTSTYTQRCIISCENFFQSNRVCFHSWRVPLVADGKEYACNAGGPGSIPGSGRSPGEGNGNPLQYSCLENSMDRGAWRATVHGVTKCRKRLRD